ncbi:MAG: transporter related protein [Rhizobium sp.]|nr:transporter related protein [Rhizobium sp.]
MSGAAITLSKLGKSFEQKRIFGGSTAFHAVRDVSLSVAPGRTLGIVGESGSGKSTLLRMVLRLIAPTAGTVEIDGEDIWALASRDLKGLRRKVQPIFQNPSSSFNPRQTIGAILTAPLEVHGIGDRKSRRDKAVELLERVGLMAAHAERLPHQLSGGQKQRVAIARAVILEPRIVLADEPTSALDVSVQAQVLDLFQEIKSAMGLTSVFVSHNLAVIRQVSDEVAVMRLGEVVEYGPVEQIFAAPQHDYTRALIAAVPDHAHLFTTSKPEDPRSDK